MIYSVTLNPSIDYIVEVENFRQGILNRTSNDYVNIGGKGIMVSKLLSNIGVKNTALGFLGGFTGEHILKWFHERGYTHDFTMIRESTRINVKLKSSLESEINARGPVISKGEQATFLNKLEKLSGGDVLIISGSTIPGADSDIVRQMIAICHEKGANFVIDTTGSALYDALSERPLLIKPNIHELGELFHAELHTKEEVLPYGKTCLALGAQHTIVSMGGDGALFFSGEQTLYAPPVKGKPVNTVGAGDSMIAGFIGSYQQGKSLADSFAYAVASGTATAFCEDIAEQKDIEQVLQQIVLIPMS